MPLGCMDTILEYRMALYSSISDIYERTPVCILATSKGRGPKEQGKLSVALLGLYALRSTDK